LANRYFYIFETKTTILNFECDKRASQFYTYAFAGAIAFSGLFTYAASSPFLFLDILVMPKPTVDFAFHVVEFHQC
jgi:DHA1 family bicyclomycin/chloramphenicol resistance-like MFS transporter